jgi:hypothetical protein
MSKALVVALLATLTLTARLAAAEPDAPEYKNPNTALALSAGGTLLSVAVTAAGIDAHNGALTVVGALSSLVTPSAGEFYAGEKGVTIGLGLRLLGSGVAIAGAAEALKCFGESSCERNPALAEALLITGGVSYASGILLDIALAGSAAEDFNRKHDLHVAPVVSRATTSGQTLGLGITGSF